MTMKEEKLLRHDPLSETDAIMRDDFYGRRTGAPRTAAGTEAPPLAAKPTHYKVICISMYNQDIKELEAKVAELKKRGMTKANKSQLIRLALQQLDLDKIQMPRQ